MARHAMLGLVALSLGLSACKSFTEASVGFADSMASTSLPSDAGGYVAHSIELPGLTDLNPLVSPGLSRYELTPDEIESVEVTSVALEGDAGACGLSVSKLEVQLVSVALGPVSLATATGAECLEWTLASETELAPWFRQATISIVALADGVPFAGAAQSISLRVSFLIDVEDRPME